MLQSYVVVVEHGAARGTRLGSKTHFETAIGSSQDPGTDCTTIFDSLTPEANSFFFVPSMRGSIIAILQQE
jgi:hypothetical protein